MDSQLIEVVCNVTSIGLALDIVGVVLLFFFGPPVPKVFLDGSEIVYDSPDPIKARRAKCRNYISKLALIFLFAGFTCQLFGGYESSKIISQLEKKNQELTGDLGRLNTILSDHEENYKKLKDGVVKIKDYKMFKNSVMEIEELSKFNSSSIKQVEEKSSTIEDQLLGIKEQIKQLETIVKSYNK